MHRPTLDSIPMPWLPMVVLWVFAATSAGAQSGLLQSLRGTNEAPRLARAADGSVRFIGAPAGSWLAVAESGDVESRAAAFLRQHRAAFGVSSARARFMLHSVRPVHPGGSKAELERTAVAFDQVYDGVPVFGARATVQMGPDGVQAALLDLLRSTTVLDAQTAPTIPSLTGEMAWTIARSALATQIPGVELETRGTPKLVVFAPEVLDLAGPPRLAWQVDLASLSGFPAERLLVDAHTGQELVQYSLAHSALRRRIFDAEKSNTVPDEPARTDDDPPTGIPDIDQAFDFSADTYDFYLDEHGRDSIDDAGLPLVSVVRFCPSGNCFEDNAFWDGSRAFYTEGMTADDVVGHEITHGLSQYTSGLIYLNQSGAINESLSDIWGEFIDLGNGVGNDGGIARWLIAEDAATGYLRDMADPPARNNPDSTCSPLYFEGLGDNGGVHFNSGILNKLAYLLVDGDTFNGHTITGMGIPLVADLFYEIQTQLLVPGSNFVDAYFAMGQAAINLGLDAAQQANLDNAMRAVNIDPESNCHPPPAPPINGVCADALPITYGEMIGYTTEGTLSGAPTCSVNEAADVWYVFTAERDETVSFSTCSFAEFDTSISVFDGCAGTRLACNDDDLSCGLESTAFVDVIAGHDYYVRISGYGGQFGEFVLTVAGETDGTACGGDLLEVFAAGFETDLGGVETNGLWHRTDTCRTLDPDHGSDHALYFGSDSTCNYDTGQSEQGFATVAVDLTPTEGSVGLSFDRLLQWSGNGELVALEASSDSGATWTTLASNTSPPFLFPTSSWTCTTFDLSEYAGGDLLLRFGFDTVMPISTPADGFYIDNLSVEAEGFQGQGVIVPCEAPGYVIHEADFESDDADYALNGLWHRSAVCAASNPSHHSERGLYFGVDETCSYDTGQIEAGEAVSPPIEIHDSPGLVLMSLLYHLETDENIDIAGVEISRDDGETWSQLASSMGVPQLEDGGGLWKCGTYNLSAYAGQTIRIRLSFDTVFAVLNGFSGFFVDDIRITTGREAPFFADGFESGDLAGWGP